MYPLIAVTVKTANNPAMSNTIINSMSVKPVDLAADSFPDLDITN
jgi:hypothetical protein